MDLIITHLTLLIEASQFILMGASQTVHASIGTLLLILGIELLNDVEIVSYLIFFPQ